MKRMIYLPDDVKGQTKYRLKDEYRSCGIYEEVCPTGYVVYQSWAVVVPNFGTLEIQSFMSQCKDELLDAIDNFYDEGKFGYKAFHRSFGYCVHNLGKVEI